MKTLTQSLSKVIMWYKIKRLFEEHHSVHKIFSITGLHRRTITRYLQMSESEFLSFASKQRIYPKFLDAYYTEVKELIDKDHGIPASVVEDRLRERHADFPYVNSKTVYNFVQYVRRQENIHKPKDPDREFEQIPPLEYGAEAQVDFGESWLRDEHGKRRKVYFFVLVLSRSRYKFVCFQTSSFTGGTAVEAHEKAFEYIEGIPEKLVYDQDSVFLSDENLGDYMLATDFRSYRDERHLSVVFCRKADPQSKGKVENVVKYVKNNFLRSRTFYNIDRLNQEVLSWLERTGNGSIHASTRLVPRQEWMKEKEYLRVFTPVHFNYESTPKAYTVRKDNTISYHGNFYTLPYGTFNAGDTQLFPVEKDGMLMIYSANKNLIAQHAVCTEKGRLVSNTSHRRDRTSRVNLFKEEVLSLLPDNEDLLIFVEYIHKHKSRYLRDNLTIIRQVINAYSNVEVTEALTYCLKHQLYNASRLKDAAEHQRKINEMPQKPALMLRRMPSVISSQRKDDAIHTPSKSDILTYEKIMQ